MSQIPNIPDDAVLCYVCSGTAYFTTQALADQWGDDWDDAPYEHNAGEPYGPRVGTSAWSIYRLKFEGLTEPCDLPNIGSNSPWSVQDINARAVPWLTADPWGAASLDALYAGATVADFVRFVQKHEGVVYAPLRAPEVG